jgi:pyruvate,orthophosphate dikinase
MACEQVTEGLIDEPTALGRLEGLDLADIHTVRVAAAEGSAPLAVGVPASPGVAVGEAVFDPERAAAAAGGGRTPILIRTDLATADIAGLAASAGVLTARGGRTSHAAVVARQLNKPCIVSCPGLVLQDQGRGCRIGDRLLEEGATVSLDGHTGRVYAGRVEVVVERPTPYLQEVGRWRARWGKGLPPSPEPVVATVG